MNLMYSSPVSTSFLEVKPKQRFFFLFDLQQLLLSQAIGWNQIPTRSNGLVQSPPLSPWVSFPLNSLVSPVETNLIRAYYSFFNSDTYESCAGSH